MSIKGVNFFLTLFYLKTTIHNKHTHKKKQTNKQLAKDTLEELDWCLKKLESVDSAKSMGLMARDKFQRIMHRELSHLSEKSKSGSQVAEWVHTLTSWGKCLIGVLAWT